MYIPPHFVETRPDELHRLIHEHPLGILVTESNSLLDADHIPFDLDTSAGEKGLLRAHVARANPLWTHADGAEVLVIFRGSQACISPNWYPSKHESHRQVPTWNYQVVHVRGRLSVRDDERFVRGNVARLTRTHEAGEAKPWKMTDSSPDYIDQMLAAIVGIEIEISEMTGKWKLSQNKEARDVLSVAQILEQQGNETLAKAMREALRNKA
jgi:transcriptional regulator